jgi:hypothetical protein
MFLPSLTAAVVALSLATGCTALPATTPKPSNSETSITVLFNNTLDLTQDFRALPFIILDDHFRAQAAAACAALNEKVLNTSVVQAHVQEVQNQLAYQAFAGYRSTRDQGYFLSDGVVVVSVDENDGTSTIKFEPFDVFLLLQRLPVLCTNAQAIGNSPESAVATAQNEVIVKSNTNTYIGYRNQKSLRFLGIPYTPPPTRWVHSALNPARNTVFNATAYGSECAQIEAVGSEDCLFLNIQTPYLPQQGSNDRSLLRPVLFWIHGGAFTGGTGADPGSDGGQLASREDLVTVTINYRLSTLGFLCLPGTDITGNYGIGDQVTALEVRFVILFFAYMIFLI